ncbi:MAG: T9SS type A sorting domain-containing protein [Flavobacteriales bacterium]|nr:T9SS type A sorting domain-containing protein [Flavobacteriales bacterium]
MDLSLHNRKRLSASMVAVLLMISSAIGQGLDNLWMGGYENFSPPPWGGSDVDFVTGSPVISLQARDIDLYHTATNITDASGNLLFFTNGVVVGKQDGDTMQNGSGLNPSDYTDNWYPAGLLLYQANLIIPDPGDPNHYYLFHSTIDNLPAFTPQYLYVSVIDMSLNGGEGEVVSKNLAIFDGPLQIGRLNAVRHGNGRDWWVYAHEYNSDVFLRWLVTPQGPSGPLSQNVGLYKPLDAGQVVFSQDGQRFAYYTGDTTGLDLFDVDRCDGTFTYAGHVDVDSVQYGVGVSFSPSGRFLYLSAVTELYQVDADATDLQASLTVIAVWDSTYSPGFPFRTVFGASKLAPDGKIYISTMNSTDKLHVINQPDSLGLACDVVQNGITLPTYWKNSIPNHPNYHLGALDGSICDSLGLGVVDRKPEFNLTLFPNPNAGAFTLSFAPQPVAGWLVVYDVNGRLVHSEGIAPWSQLKRMHLVLPAGVYQCRLIFGGSVAVRRFVDSSH